MARQKKGPLFVTPNPPKQGGTQVPDNAMNGEKTIPAAARMKGLSGGPAYLTKASRGGKFGTNKTTKGARKFGIK